MVRGSVVVCILLQFSYIYIPLNNYSLAKLNKVRDYLPLKNQ